MKYKQRILIVLSISAVCAVLLYIGPVVTDEQLRDRFLLGRNHLDTEGYSIKGRLDSWVPNNAHLHFMRKDLDLSNYTGDVTHENSSELLQSETRRQRGHIFDKSAADMHEDSRFINSVGISEDPIISHVKDVLLDDNTFKREENLNNLLFIADIIKQNSLKKNKTILTKVDIFHELGNRLKLEGNLVPEEAKPTLPPKDIGKKVIVFPEEWNVLKNIKPSAYSQSRKRRRKRGPLLNIYPKPRS